MNIGLVKSVARGLRYRPLEHLVGRSVTIADLATFEQAVRLTLGPDLPEGCRLEYADLFNHEVCVAKHGILDLCFTAPEDLLAGDVRTGVPLLRELGFLPRKDDAEEMCSDPAGLEMLRDQLLQGKTYLMLFMQAPYPGNLLAVMVRPSSFRRLRRFLRWLGVDLPTEEELEYGSFGIRKGYLPKPFRIIDACVTNAPGVWLWKHFYL